MTRAHQMSQRLARDLLLPTGWYQSGDLDGCLASHRYVSRTFRSHFCGRSNRFVGHTAVPIVVALMCFFPDFSRSLLSQHSCVHQQILQILTPILFDITQTNQLLFCWWLYKLCFEFCMTASHCNKSSTTSNLLFFYRE